MTGEANARVPKCPPADAICRDYNAAVEAGDHDAALAALHRFDIHTDAGCKKCADRKPA